MNEEAKKVLNSLQAACARREYCSYDILQKASRKLPDDPSSVEGILESLVSEGYVNDSRYAAAFAREKAGITGWGPVKIRFALAAKRIPKADIDSAISELDDDKSGARLDRLLQAKARTLKGDPQFKLKLLKFALSRGYEYDAVKDKVDDLQAI